MARRGTNPFSALTDHLEVEVVDHVFGVEAEEETDGRCIQEQAHCKCLVVVLLEGLEEEDVETWESQEVDSEMVEEEVSRVTVISVVSRATG